MKRLLLATDGSGHALGASKYLSDLYPGTSDVEITVLHVSPPAPPIYREEHRDPQIRTVYQAWRKEKERNAQRYIEDSLRVLLKGGFKRSQIKSKHVQQVVGLARDILREADAEHYDACVIGRKGMGWFDEVFLGSITSKLLEISENHPIWLVSGNKGDSRKVLVAMDHTHHSIRLARAAGEMLQDLKGVHIRFYHYCAPLTEDLTAEERRRLKEIERRMVANEKDQMLHFFDEAKRVLADLGFDRNAVECGFSQGKSASPRVVSQSILEEVQKGKFGTLIMGRKGATSAREFRLGSTALRIATEAEDCAVWVV